MDCDTFTPEPEFATSPICIKDADYEFSVDLSLISTVEAEPFCGNENESATEHINKLSGICLVLGTEKKKQQYYLTKLFPFSLKDKAKTWFNNLPYGSIKSPQD